MTHQDSTTLRTGPSERVARTAGPATGLGGGAYADPRMFDVEVAKILRTGWIPVGRSRDLANPGDYRTVDLFGAPLVVTRDHQGETHVLSGVCRHRGMLVAAGAGNAKGLICPYHLWRYDLDGTLMTAPAMDQNEGFNVDNCALPKVRHETWGGWIFANLDGAAAPLADQLGPLAARLEATAPESLVTADVVELTSPWNWKIMVENFMESYHHIGPHSGTLQRTNPGLLTFEGAGGDLYSILENPPAAGQDPFVVAAIFPLTLMYFSGGATPVGVWYELDAIRHDSFNLRIHLLAPPELADQREFVAGFRAQVLAVHREDLPVCEGTWAGVRSPLYTAGPLSHLEASIQRFHQHLSRRLGA